MAHYSVSLKYEKHPTKGPADLAQALRSLPGNDVKILEGEGKSAMMVEMTSERTVDAARAIPFAVVEDDNDLDLL